MSAALVAAFVVVCSYGLFRGEFFASLSRVVCLRGHCFRTVRDP